MSELTVTFVIHQTQGPRPGSDFKGKIFNTEVAEFTEMNTEHAPINDLTKVIIGCAIEVHKALGPGLLESAYEHCLAWELVQRGLTIERQKPLPVVYKGTSLDAGYRVDLLVDGKVIVELKAVEKTLPIHEQQVLSYLRLSGLTVGLLLNFNVSVLREGITRIINGSIQS